MDVAKYRALFLEEATEHLAEMGRALLALEKEPADEPALATLFRMAHSIKGMAASLGYDAITEVAHRLEDRLGRHREAGRVAGAGELERLFAGLEGLERLVGHVREHGVGPRPAPALVEALSAPVEGSGAASEAATATAAPEPTAKKARTGP